MSGMHRAGGRRVLEVDIRNKTFRVANGGRLTAIRDLAFSVPSGQFACLVGPSGCGKTTALRIILGLERDFDGAVTKPDGRVAAVFQEPRLLPWRSVGDNVRLALDRPDEAKLGALFETLGLTGMERMFPGELSLGLARRAALARAFAVEPALLLLDEPFVSLDDATAGKMRALLMSVWSARPTTALMVTHNLREAAELADRLIILSPRPATVRGIIDIAEPRAARDADTLDRIVGEARRLVDL